MLVNPQHRAVVPEDSRLTSLDEPIIFKWHFPRGTFDSRMSALELAQFILPHMPSILPLLADHPRVQAEFFAILNRLTTWPQNVIDEVVPWIKSVRRTEEDDIIELDLRAKMTERRKRVIFDMGG